jgi:hypothetical protein
VERILKLVRDGIVQWISSDALADEIDRNRFFLKFGAGLDTIVKLNSP